MQNKILIVGGSAREQSTLEEILQEIVEEGGELLFTDNKEEGMTLLYKENPQLVFLDLSLLGKDVHSWSNEGSHIILMGHPNELQHHPESDYLMKPFKSRHVLEKCRTCLGHESISQPPPM